MTDNKQQTSKKKTCPARVVVLREGQLCPFCGFATMVREPGNIIKCPVCGYGPGRKYT